MLNRNNNNFDSNKYEYLLQNTPIVSTEMYGIAKRMIEKKNPSLKNRFHIINTPIYYSDDYHLKFHEYPTRTFEITNRNGDDIRFLEDGKKIAKECCNEVKNLIKNKEQPFAVIVQKRNGIEKDEFKDLVKLLKGERTNFPLHVDFLIVNENKVFFPLNYNFIKLSKIMSDELRKEFGDNYIEGVKLLEKGETAKNIIQEDFLSCTSYAFEMARMFLENDCEALEGAVNGFQIPEKIAPFMQIINERCGCNHISKERPFEDFRRQVASEYLKTNLYKLLPEVQESELFQSEVGKIRQSKDEQKFEFINFKNTKVGDEISKVITENQNANKLPKYSTPSCETGKAYAF